MIILDIMLPSLDCFTLIEHIPDFTSIIFVTAMGNQSNRVNGLQLEANDYIIKPFETVELLARIHAVLRCTKQAANLCL